MSQCSNANAKGDIGHLVISMTEQLDYYWSLSEVCDEGPESSTICRVQQHIREVDKFSYEPLVLSIGPYHHGASALEAMEREKWSYLDFILKLNCEKNLLDYLTELRKIAKHARLCYSEDIKMEDDEFLEMLLLDGCFILTALGGTNELFKRLQQRSGTASNCDSNTAEDTEAQITSHLEESNDSQAQTSNYGINQNGSIKDRFQYDDVIGPWFARFVCHDLLLLENQIPFFVVKKIFELVACQGTVAPCTDAIAKAIETALCWYPKSIQESCRPKEFCHVLHLCLLYFRPTVKKEDSYHYQVGPQYIDKFLSFGRNYLRIRNHRDDNEYDIRAISANEQYGQHLNRWRRAIQYSEAGVKFMKMEQDKVDPHSLLDIHFKNGVMKMPCVAVDEYTEGLFRNLIAFEQNCPQYGDDFTAYIVFLSQLISMPEDVALLGQRKIIEHHLDSDDQVSDIFTMLSKDLVFDFNGNYYLKSLCLTMEAHYQSRINRWVAWLRLNHFSNPWLALAAFATVIVLVCTIVQTIYGILAYVDPPK
ncbi:hypothetical protein BS78_06G257600 [Paspalum vaginatum]|nr:hypothetical protein BS78_06G257600 [Paspalum vaginatum]KAJ1273141.1 hypothetical protein BS78_06G257600 [Paspalum vaginatum]KAJ1273142.1 hypothetical protein BS78_06G257600 [Paspalum vaginatum]